MTTALHAALALALPAASQPPLPWSVLWDALERAGVQTTAGELDVALRAMGAEHPASCAGAMLYGLPAGPRTSVPTTTGGTLPAPTTQPVVAGRPAQGVLGWTVPAPVAVSPSPGLELR